MLLKKLLILLIFGIGLGLTLLLPSGSLAADTQINNQAPSITSANIELPTTPSTDDWTTIRQRLHQPTPATYIPPASIEIDQTKKVTASDGGIFDQFGLAVAISGDTAIVGANQDPGRPGAAYIYERNQGGLNNWGEVKKLTALFGEFDDQFGISVAIEDDTVVIGAWHNDSHRGAAYIFQRNQGGTNNWGQVKKLTASDGVADDLFGSAVAINGDTVIVGANGDNSYRGSAYIFERNQGGANNWGQVKKLVAIYWIASDQFGYAVAISNNTVIIGAWGESSFRGSAYIFERNQGGANNWGQVKKLTASDGVAADHFGETVTINGDTVVVGADSNDDKGDGSGSVYIFERNQGGTNNWGQVKKLLASDGATNDQFGRWVALRGNRLVVGAIGDDFARGSVYVFERHQGGTNSWGEVGKLTANDGVMGDRFGGAVDLSTNTILVGASADDPSFTGAAYIFSITEFIYLPFVWRN